MSETKAFGGVDSWYPVPKWLHFLYRCGDCFSLPAFFFSVSFSPQNSNCYLSISCKCDVQSRTPWGDRIPGQSACCKRSRLRWDHSQAWRWSKGGAWSWKLIAQKLWPRSVHHNITNLKQCTRGCQQCHTCKSSILQRTGWSKPADVDTGCLRYAHTHNIRSGESPFALRITFHLLSVLKVAL